MEKIEVIISTGTRSRIDRIKELRGIILDDMEVIIVAIGIYWAEAEKRAANRVDSTGYREVS